MKTHPMQQLCCVLFLLFFLNTTACTGDATTEVPQPTLTGERLYLATKNTPYNPYTGTGGLKNYFLVLLPDGTAYNGLPKQSVLGELDRSALMAENQLRVGDYTEQGGQLTITWTYNQGKVWQLDGEEGAWRQNASKLYEMIQPAKHGNSLQGTFTYEYQSAAGFPGTTPAGTLYVKDELVFRADGTFTRHIFTGGAADQGTGQGEQLTHGSYTWQGYRLQLLGDDGTAFSFTTFPWPGEERQVLAINGKRYLK